MTRHPFRRLLDYAHAYRGRVLLATVYSISNKVFDLAPPALIGAAVDVVVERDESFLARLGIADTADQLWVLLAATIAIWSLESLFEWLAGITWRNLAQAVEHDARVDAYRHVQSLELAYFHRESAGGLMSVLNDDVNQLERFLDYGADNIVQLVTTTVVISAVFFVLAPSVAWFAMAPIPLILWGSIKYQSLLGRRYGAVRERVGDLNGLLSNNLRGIATIKAFDTEGFETERVRAESAAYRDANARAISLSAAFSPLIRFVIVIGFSATLVWGGMLALDGELAVGTYSVLVFMTQRLLWPLTRLGQTMDLYQRARASTERIMNLLDTAPGIVEGATDLPQPVRGEIAFENVTFSYSGREPVLNDFDLRVDAGKTLGIVGTTGAGKTTLINLLLRFFDPQKGRVTIDGVDVRELRFASIRAAVGLVSQQVFLFSGTIRENVAYGTFEASDEEVAQAARAAELEEFVNSLPKGWATIVGERGETLSGGQRQRVSLARAILENAPILVLDEATSAVDNETEAAIQRSLDRISRDRTTLIIAHRLSTVRNADEIIVLEDGEIAERGTHDDLIAADGIYARLWRVQTGEKGAQYSALPLRGPGGAGSAAERDGP